VVNSGVTLPALAQTYPSNHMATACTQWPCSRDSGAPGGAGPAARCDYIMARGAGLRVVAVALAGGAREGLKGAPAAAAAASGAAAAAVAEEVASTTWKASVRGASAIAGAGVGASPVMPSDHKAVIADLVLEDTGDGGGGGGGRKRRGKGKVAKGGVEAEVAAGVAAGGGSGGGGSGGSSGHGGGHGELRRRRLTGAM